jgi:hypothetical protein
VSQATVAKYMMRRDKPPSQLWRTFLPNHVAQIVAADFFVVPTVTYRLLFVLVILAHEPAKDLPRRRHRPSHSRMDSTAASQRLSRGPSAAVPGRKESHTVQQSSLTGSNPVSTIIAG